MPRNDRTRSPGLLHVQRQVDPDLAAALEERIWPRTPRNPALGDPKAGFREQLGSTFVNPSWWRGQCVSSGDRQGVSRDIGKTRWSAWSDVETSSDHLGCHGGGPFPG